MISQFSYITTQGCGGNRDKIMEKQDVDKEPTQRCCSQRRLCAEFILITTESMYIFHAALYCSALLPKQVLEQFSF